MGGGGGCSSASQSSAGGSGSGSAEEQEGSRCNDTVSTSSVSGPALILASLRGCRAASSARQCQRGLSVWQLAAQCALACCSGRQLLRRPRCAQLDAAGVQHQHSRNHGSRVTAHCTLYLLDRRQLQRPARADQSTLRTTSRMDLPIKFRSSKD